MLKKDFCAILPTALRAVGSMTAIGCTSLIAACGGSGGAPPGGAPPGGTPPGSLGNSPQAVTQVVVVLSSTASDRFTDLGAVVEGITLTNGSGKAVALLSQSLGAEFVHVNGRVEPAITGTLPQDTYTAANVIVGYAAFNCVALNASGGLQDSLFAYGAVPADFVTVSLPAPISVTGDSMGVTLQMQVEESATLASCSQGASYAIHPTFTLTAFDIVNAPAGSPDNTVLSLEGAVTAVSGASNGFELLRPAYMSQPSTRLAVSTDESTIFQGIDALATMAPGMFVNIDGAIQPDGSVHATRVAVADAAAVDVRRGPIVSVFRNAAPTVEIRPVEGQGKDDLVDVETYDTARTAFHISGQLTNVAALPFAATFDAADMVPGQVVYLSSPAFVTCCGQDYYAPATTLTLMPQTIDGTVLSSSISGSFTVYEVQLAADDPFVSLAAQPGQAALLTQPDVVQVYVDGSTRMQNSALVAVGGTLRFYGLVFNDQGVLRMDCAQIDDGVSDGN